MEVGSSFAARLRQCHYRRESVMEDRWLRVDERVESWELSVEKRERTEGVEFDALLVDEPAGRESERALDDVLQLADVAGPRMVEEFLQGRGS